MKRTEEKHTISDVGVGEKERSGLVVVVVPRELLEAPDVSVHAGRVLVLELAPDGAFGPPLSLPRVICTVAVEGGRASEECRLVDRTQKRVRRVEREGVFQGCVHRVQNHQIA